MSCYAEKSRSIMATNGLCVGMSPSSRAERPLVLITSTPTPAFVLSTLDRKTRSCEPVRKVATKREPHASGYDEFSPCTDDICLVGMDGPLIEERSDRSQSVW